MEKQTKILRSKSKTLKPAIIIGKSGLTPEVINNINEYLKKNELIKIKILNSFIQENDKNEFFLEISKKTNTKIIDKIGFTITLKK